MKNASSAPAAIWPVSLNLLCWLLILKVLMASTNDPIDALLIGFAVAGASAINLLGALIALFRRKQAIAAWYGVTFLATLVIGVVAIGWVDRYQNHPTLSFT